MRRHSKQGTRKATIAKIELPPRQSRHNRPMVGEESPYQKPPTSRAVHHERSIVTDPESKALVVVPAYDEVIKVPGRALALEEVQRERAKIYRATECTTSRGSKNTPDNMAPKGKGGAKPGPGKR